MTLDERIAYLHADIVKHHTLSLAAYDAGHDVEGQWHANLVDSDLDVLLRLTVAEKGTA